VSHVRAWCALITFGAFALVAGGCDLFQPPQAPEMPETPEEADRLKSKGGNCCIREENALVKKHCGGEAASCCIPDIDEDACASRKGLWFFTPEGCAGAC
jgi:hypothetical protein